jgi:hypothetical protein
MTAQYTKRLFAIGLLVVASERALAADPQVGARVECEFQNLRYIPFTAGEDRCWNGLSGKPWSPKAAIACAVEFRDGRLRVNFRLSERAVPECDTEEAMEKPATPAQVAKALPLLGKKEREFFVKHAITSR